MSAETTPRAPLPRMPLPVWVNRPFAYSEAAPESLEDLTYYPSSDGQPMSDNTTQFDWISMLQGELDSLFAEDPNFRGAWHGLTRLFLNAALLMPNRPVR